jgi:hypothetical protein
LAPVERVWEETAQHEKIIEAAKDAIEKDDNDLGAWKRLLNTFSRIEKLFKIKSALTKSAISFQPKLQVRSRERTTLLNSL